MTRPRRDGYPDHYHRAVEGTFRRSLMVMGVTLLVAGVAIAACIYLNAPLIFGAFALAIFLLFGVLGSIFAIIDVRQARVIPYFPQPVGDIDTFLSGRAIASNLRFLDDLAEIHGARKLSSFGFNDDLLGEELVWHDCVVGVEAVDVLLTLLRTSPGQVASVDKVIAELSTLRQAFERAAAKCIPFCLLFRFGNSTSGHEWSIRKGTAF